MFEGSARILESALESRAFSAVAAEVGTGTGPRWNFAAGRVTFDEASSVVTSHTVFDLASLTKVIATTTLAMTLVQRGRLDLAAPVASFIPEWTATDRATVTVTDLLEHASGLPGHRPYFQTLTGRHDYQRAIAAEPLEHEPRTRAIYSDLGFMLLGFILEDVGGESLDQQFDAWRRTAGITAPIRFLPPPEWWPAIAATENDTWRGQLLQGQVHDENAAALGGVAAHAGLFGTAAAVGQAARWWLRLLRAASDANTAGSTDIEKDVVRRFVTRSLVPNSSRALGWDTMLTTSSCGTCMSNRAIGHTGFTGTSLWLDPERDFYAVLLTNRVHPTRDNNAIQAVRRDFHDAAVTESADDADNAQISP
jgi:CubicO group peptidase (beta-lactamase class C family)